jgi:nitrous oxidase accessory protein
MGGKYYEHLQVNKAVNLTGQGMPVLDATASGSAITLKADGITVRGFKIVIDNIIDKYLLWYNSFFS